MVDGVGAARCGSGTVQDCNYVEVCAGLAVCDLCYSPTSYRIICGTFFLPLSVSLRRDTGHLWPISFISVLETAFRMRITLSCL